jgi:hypothetical protein
VSYLSVHTWLRESCVLSISPYLGEVELCPIHQSLPALGKAVSYPLVPTWVRESSVLSVRSYLAGKSCVLSSRPYVGEGELYPTHQALPG